MKNNRNIRKQLQDKYYNNWKDSRAAFEEHTKANKIKMYDNYIEKIEQFMNEINWILENDKTLKENFKANYRQTGGYRRCMSDEPSGWGTRDAQFGQRYKELMVDYLYYSDDLEYDDMSIEELNQIEEMALFLYNLALKNKKELEMQIDKENFVNKVNLKGYLTKRPDVKRFESGNMCSSFILAVLRDYKNKDGKYDVDYFSIICWNDIAKESLKYFADDFIELEGHLQTRSYVNDKGEKRFVVEVICTKIKNEKQENKNVWQSRIELNKENIDIIKYDDVIAVSIAEGGAMGEPNGFYVMDINCKLYHLNFADTDIEKEQLYSKFPLLDGYSCFFGQSSKPIGWDSFYMGFGNYLLVREKFYNGSKKYIEQNLSEDYEHGELYNRWYEVLKHVVDNEELENDIDEEYDPDKEYEFRENTIEQIGEINLTKRILENLNEDDILFIETSNDGTTYLMDNKTKLYYVGHPNNKEITEEYISKIFTKFAKANVENEKDYKAINLGMGHALSIKTKIYDDYMKLLRENIIYENEFEDCYTAYCHWIDCAIKFINK